MKIFKQEGGLAFKGEFWKLFQRKNFSDFPSPPVRPVGGGSEREKRKRRRSFSRIRPLSLSRLQKIFFLIKEVKVNGG